MFYLGYMLNELRRRKGRTLLTALGLAVGVALVVAVSALSTGLDEAQARVLKPLTGVGTDLSVTRPIEISGTRTGPGFPRLSEDEREQLQRENGPARIGLRDLGEPGTRFSRDSFVSGAQLSLPASQVRTIGRLDGVRSAAGGLTLNALHIEGTVPERPTSPRSFGAPVPAAGPEGIDASAVSVAGVDQRYPGLGAVTQGQVVRGRYFSKSATTREAIVSESHAAAEDLALGEKIKLAGKTFTVVGIARAPLGAEGSDVYMKLSQLQAMSGRKGRVNTVYVRATSADRVAAVADMIERSVSGASVTTAEELAERVSGSLVDANRLTDRLGLALAGVGLLAAFLITSLLTLASVAKRIRELGTLKAIGWRQRLVVRQVAGESLLQAMLGAALGVGLGIGAAALLEAVAPSLTATVAESASAGPVVLGPFGQGSAPAQELTISLDAPVSETLLVLAVGLALAGGLVSGAVGALRAARLRPADALRHVD